VTRQPAVPSRFFAKKIAGGCVTVLPDEAVKVQILKAPRADAGGLGIAPLTRPAGKDWLFGAAFRVTDMQAGRAAVTAASDRTRAAFGPDGRFRAGLDRADHP
jgi:hypothetical protein